MATCRDLLQLLPYGLFICCFIIMLSFYGWDMSHKLKDMRMNQVQEERKQLIKEMCQSNKKTFSQQLTHDVESNLIVDDTNGLIYCYIPKAACSSLKRLMVVLAKGEPYGDPRMLKGIVEDKVTPLKTFPKTEIKAKLKHYTKFLFVRDPFVRLISAYRDQFKRFNEPFYYKYGRDILRVSGTNPNPPRTWEEAHASGIHISFYNFIQYLLDQRTEEKKLFDEHWKQMYRLCHPCHIQYDFIGHQETLREDLEHLLKITVYPDDIIIPSPYVNMTSSDSVVNWFKTVPLEDRRKLYELYKTDFELFGYEKPEELFQG